MEQTPSGLSHQCLVRLSNTILQPIRTPHAVLCPPGPPALHLPQPGLFSTSAGGGFLRASSALGQAFRDCSLVYCLSPPRQAIRLALHRADMQSRAWHGAGAQQTSAGGMTLVGRQTTLGPQKCIVTSCCWFLPGGGSGKWERQGRPASPWWPDWTRAGENQAGQTKKTSSPPRQPLDAVWGPGGAQSTA